MTKKATKNDIMSEVEKLPTTSAKVRYLDAQGMSRAAIAKALNIRYQWVRNVLVTPVAKPKA